MPRPVSSTAHLCRARCHGSAPPRPPFRHPAKISRSSTRLDEAPRRPAEEDYGLPSRTARAWSRYSPDRGGVPGPPMDVVAVGVTTQTMRWPAKTRESGSSDRRQHRETSADRPVSDRSDHLDRCVSQDQNEPSAARRRESILLARDFTVDGPVGSTVAGPGDSPQVDVWPRRKASAYAALSQLAVGTVHSGLQRTDVRVQAPHRRLVPADANRPVRRDQVADAKPRRKLTVVDHEPVAAVARNSCRRRPNHRQWWWRRPRGSKSVGAA